MKRWLYSIAALAVLSLAPLAHAEHLWTEVPQQTARYAPCDLKHPKAAYFKGYFYVIGTKAAIWRSLDGRTWDRITDNPPFGKRDGHCLLVFNNKLWLLGGSKDAYLTNYQPQNDVWYTDDGLKWTRALEHAPWSARFDHAAVVFNNKMWIFGGSRSKGVGSKRPDGSMNDVWYSSNGLTWTGTLWGVEWQPRAGHEVIVYQNMLWLIGGNHFNDVWVSTNGLEWNLREDKCPWGERRGHALMDIGGRLWVLGGETETTEIGGLLRDSYSTLDGVTWRLEHNDYVEPYKWQDGSWCDRTNYACCKGGDGRWYIFPSYATGMSKNDSWKMASTGAFGGKLLSLFYAPLGTTNICPLVYNNRMYIFTPRIHYDWYPPTAWYSTDGSNWTAIWAGPVEFTGQVFSYMGYLWALENRYLSKSLNGGGWAPLSDPPIPIPAGLGAYLFGWSDRMWLVNPGPPTEIYQSTNGIDWTLTIYPSQGLDLGSNIVVFKTWLWSYNKIVRYSRDAIQWVPSKPIPWQTENYRILVMGDRVWAVTDTEGIWSSENGMDWARMYDPPDIPPNEVGPLRNTIAYQGYFWNFTTGKPPAGGKYNPDDPWPGKAWRLDTTNAVKSDNWLYYR
ncbi:hypothetical protein LLG95_06765 [bacterium]|nr:hypothetical protein [bacterium]